MSEMKLNFQGFQPSVIAEDFVKTSLEKIVATAPRKAFLHGHFSKNKKVFKGFVQVLSSGHEFFASAEGSQLKNVIKLISTQLRKKMERQKKIRITHQRIPECMSVPEGDDTDLARSASL
jgi:cobalamin biosynthesis protein CbiD